MTIDDDDDDDHSCALVCNLYECSVCVLRNREKKTLKIKN